MLPMLGSIAFKKMAFLSIAHEDSDHRDEGENCDEHPKKPVCLFTQVFCSLLQRWQYMPDVKDDVDSADFGATKKKNHTWQKPRSQCPVTCGGVLSMSLDRQCDQAGDYPDWDALQSLVRQKLGLNDSTLRRAQEGESFEDVFHNVILELTSENTPIPKMQQDLVYLLSENVKRKWATLTRRSSRRSKAINGVEPHAVPDIEQVISDRQLLLLIRKAVEQDFEARLMLAAFAKGVHFKDNKMLSVVLRLPMNRIENAKKRLIRAAKHVAETHSVQIPTGASAAKKGGKS